VDKTQNTTQATGTTQNTTQATGTTQSTAQATGTTQSTTQATGTTQNTTQNIIYIIELLIKLRFYSLRYWSNTTKVLLPQVLETLVDFSYSV
jgi:hypothetical protein